MAYPKWHIITSCSYCLARVFIHTHNKAQEPELTGTSTFVGMGLHITAARKNQKVQSQAHNTHKKTNE